MKKLLLSLLLTAFCCNLLYAEAKDVVKEPNWGPMNLVESYTVGPGIKYQKIIYPEKPLILWYTVIDLTNKYNKIEQVESRFSVPDVDRWVVPEFYKQCTRENHRVKVAWNHDFFSYDAGVNIGNNISEGEMTRIKWGRSLLAITKDKKAEIFKPDRMICRATAPNGTAVDIDSYNGSAGGFEGDCFLLNRMNSKNVDVTGLYIKLAPQAEWLVNGKDIPCKVLDISVNPIQSSKTEYVLVLRNSKRNIFDNHLKVGDILNFTQKFDGAGWGNPPADILNAFHGYPSIARDGKFHDGEYNNFENGREYENSSHVMVGISKDKTKLHVLINEMSYQSNPVNCVELTSWMILRGAWDVVNFDSGGSAAIVIDEEMLNLPGRGSIRAVKDAMIAVCTAPEDNSPHHISFSKDSITPTIVSLTPLRTLLFNQYDEVLDKNLQGCKFSCEPAELGYVDDNAVFHSGAGSMKGFIVAEKDGMVAKMPVTTLQVETIKPSATEILVDNIRRPLVGVEAVCNGDTFILDPAAFEWTTSDSEICEVVDGILVGKKNGKATVNGKFGEVSFDVQITVEIGDGQKTVYDFVDLAQVKINKSGISNLVSEANPLPDGWATGRALNFDFTGGRSPYLKFTFDKNLYSLPDSMSLTLGDKEGIVKEIAFNCKDNLGNKVNSQVKAEDALNGVYTIKFFNGDNTPFDVSQFPMQLISVDMKLNSAKKGNGKTLAIKDFVTMYPNYSGVESIVKDNENLLIGLNYKNGMLYVSCNSKKAERACLRVISTTGQEIWKGTVNLEEGANRFEINMLEAATGFYLVTIDAPAYTATEKFILR